jgi:hypothetical protein
VLFCNKGFIHKALLCCIFTHKCLTMSIMKQNVIKLGLSYWLINNVKHVYGEPFGSRKSRLSTVRRAIRAASRKGAENPITIVYLLDMWRSGQQGQHWGGLSPLCVLEEWQNVSLVSHWCLTGVPLVSHWCLTGVESILADGVPSHNLNSEWWFR